MYEDYMMIDELEYCRRTWIWEDDSLPAAEQGEGGIGAHQHGGHP